MLAGRLCLPRFRSLTPWQTLIFLSIYAIYKINKKRKQEKHIKNARGRKTTLVQAQHIYKIIAKCTARNLLIMQIHKNRNQPLIIQIPRELRPPSTQSWNRTTTHFWTVRTESAPSACCLNLLFKYESGKKIYRNIYENKIRKTMQFNENGIPLISNKMLDNATNRSLCT